MSLAEDLIQQAKDLCALDPRRPKQANLRRAVSAAYYALFHAIISAAVECMMPARSDLRNSLARQFQHKVMKATAERAAHAERAKTKQRQTDQVTPAGNDDILRVATAFVDLQEARHRADYAPDEYLTKLQATKWIDDSALAMQALSSIRSTPPGERLMWEMLLGKLDR